MKTRTTIGCWELQSRALHTESLPVPGGPRKQGKSNLLRRIDCRLLVKDWAVAMSSTGLGPA